MQHYVLKLLDLKQQNKKENYCSMTTFKQLIEALDPKYILKQEPYVKKTYVDKSTTLENAIKRGIAVTHKEESSLTGAAKHLYNAAEKAVKSFPKTLHTNADSTVAAATASKSIITPVKNIAEKSNTQEEQSIQEEQTTPEIVSAVENNNSSARTQGGRRHKKTRGRKINTSKKTRRKSTL